MTPEAERVCATFGHQHRLGDDACPCGKVPAFAPDSSETPRILDRYHALAADALCKARGHESLGREGGLTGFSWRDWQCDCGEDVEHVLRAIGVVAAHVGCREEMDRLQRAHNRAHNHFHLLGKVEARNALPALLDVAESARDLLDESLLGEWVCRYCGSGEDACECAALTDLRAALARYRAALDGEER